MKQHEEMSIPEDDAVEKRQEEERRLEEARLAIVRLERVLELNPNDVEALNELQRAYHVLGDEERREAVMRRMMAIPSKRDLMDSAKAFVASVRACAADEEVDVDRLRQEYAPIFEVVESRKSVRPGAVMELTGCGCTFAVEVLEACWRLGIVSRPYNLGQRDVIAERLHGRVCLRAVAGQEPDFAGNAPYHDRAIELLKTKGQLSAAQLGRFLDIGYGRACLILEQLQRENVVPLHE